MNTEDRLREALHERADGIEPGDDSWMRIRARIDEPVSRARTPRRPLVLAGVALATLIALVLGLAVLRDSDDGTRVATTPVPSMPGRILAITDERQPVVVNSTSGSRERAHDSFGVAEGTQIAVTPDGQSAYLVLGSGNKGCDDQSILRVNLAADSGGDADVADRATEPAVSPDGRYLAYLRCTLEGVPGSAAPRELVLRDLGTGAERSVPAPEGAFYLGGPNWAPDSRHVVYSLHDDGATSDPYSGRYLDLVGGEAAPGAVFEYDAALWRGFLGSTGDYLGVVATGSPTRVVALAGSGPRTQAVTRTLFTLPNPPQWVASDRSGRHVLAVLDGSLYRWSEGDVEPTKLADGFVAAEWIPDAPSEEAETSASSVPSAIVAATGNRLVVLDAADGAEQSELGSFPGLNRVSAAHDGSTVVFARTGAPPSACDDFIGPEIDRLDVQSGSTAIVVGGSFAPAVSPEGLIAYGFLCEGGTLGFTDANGRNYRSAPLGDTKRESSETVETIEPLGWSPDGTRLLYRVALKGEQRVRYFTGRPSVSRRGIDMTYVSELPVGSDVTAVAWLDEGTFGVATPGGDNTEVREVQLLRDGIVRVPFPVLFIVPGRVTSLVADPTGQHLLAVNQGDVLYRWSRGDAQPTKVADGVHSAAWLP